MYDGKKSEFRSVIGMAAVFGFVASGVVFGVANVIYQYAAIYAAIASGLATAIAIIGLYRAGFSDIEALALVFVWSLDAILGFLGLWCAAVEWSVIGAMIALGGAVGWALAMCIPLTKNLCIKRNTRKNKDNRE